MKRGLFSLCCTLILASLVGCSNPSSSAVQTRNDLSREHLTGLNSGMKRNDVEDLIGKNDEALASKEDFDVYTLADGTTAVLRYQGDVLRSAFIRGKDNFEEALFNDFEKPAAENDTRNGNNNNVNETTNNTTNSTRNRTNSNGTENTTNTGNNGVTDNNNTNSTNNGTTNTRNTNDNTNLTNNNNRLNTNHTTNSTESNTAPDSDGINNNETVDESRRNR